jgi:hypothetical protein
MTSLAEHTLAAQKWYLKYSRGYYAVMVGQRCFGHVKKAGKGWRPTAYDESDREIPWPWGVFYPTRAAAAEALIHDRI